MSGKGLLPEPSGAGFAANEKRGRVNVSDAKVDRATGQMPDWQPRASLAKANRRHYYPATFTHRLNRSRRSGCDRRGDRCTTPIKSRSARELAGSASVPGCEARAEGRSSTGSAASDAGCRWSDLRASLEPPWTCHEPGLFQRQSFQRHALQALRRSLTLLVLSQVKFLPARPKCPSWAVSR